MSCFSHPLVGMVKLRTSWPASVSEVYLETSDGRSTVLPGLPSQFLKCNSAELSTRILQILSIVSVFTITRNMPPQIGLNVFFLFFSSVITVFLVFDSSNIEIFHYLWLLMSVIINSENRNGCTFVFATRRTQTVSEYFPTLFVVIIFNALEAVLKYFHNRMRKSNCVQSAFITPLYSFIFILI